MTDSDGSIPLASPTPAPAGSVPAPTPPPIQKTPPIPTEKPTGPLAAATVPTGDVAAVEQLNRAYKLMAEQLAKVIVGQQEVIEQVLTAMFCQGHILLVGVPGLAKTLLVKTI